MLNKNENKKYQYRTVGIVGSSSFCIVLPASFANKLNLVKGDYVKVTGEENRIVIEKA
jgi:AbrB family looped-hinge helix DNA binding protein